MYLKKKKKSIIITIQVRDLNRNSPCKEKQIISPNYKVIGKFYTLYIQNYLVKWGGEKSHETIITTREFKKQLKNKNSNSLLANDS